jgi:hypothetical protein
MYLCEATSVRGFVQQLAVSYVRNGYFFYVPGTIPEGKDPKATDERIIQKYGIDASKWTRWKRKRAGLANIQYIRFVRFFVLLATEGEHRFFVEEPDIRDIRRFPIRFYGYSISFREGRDGKWHPSVRIDEIEFAVLKAKFMRAALTGSGDFLAGRLKALRFAPYAPVRNQYRQLLRAVNRKRKLAALETLPLESLPRRRRVVSPFKEKIASEAGTAGGAANDDDANEDMPRAKGGDDFG